LTLFDIIALSILGVSALVGFARGALREVTTVVAFIAAAYAAVFGLHFLGPLARHEVRPAWLANAIALLVLFLVVYIALRVISSGLTRSLHSTSGLGALDRAIGGGFGLVRGLVALGLINLGLHMAPAAAGAPVWITQAKLYPLSQTCADVVRAVAPRGTQIAHRLTPDLATAVNTTDDDEDASSGGGQSAEKRYDQKAGKGLDDVAEKLR
jgi:membrane protein required for colicin V production